MAERRKNNADVVEAVDPELMRHADTLARTMEAVISAGKLLRQRQGLESRVQQLQHEQARLEPEVIELRKEHERLMKRNAEVQSEGDQALESYKNDRLSAARADVDRQLQEYRSHANDAKEEAKAEVEKVRQEAEIEKGRISTEIAQVRAEMVKVQAEAQILQDTLQKLRQEVVAGV